MFSTEQVRRLLAQATARVVAQEAGEPAAQDEAQRTIAQTTAFHVFSEINIEQEFSTAPEVQDGEPSTGSVNAADLPPQGDKALMIRTKQEPHLYLVIKYGELDLVTKPTLGVGAFWYCANRSRLWYLFRNTVAGTYLSSDSRGNIWARELGRGVSEYFRRERHENGGYVLKANHKRGLFPVVISEDEDGKRLVVQEEGATAWEFIEAKDFTSSMTLTYPNIQ
jgi:hypothetical protein